MFSSRLWFETLFFKWWSFRKRFVTLNRQERAPQKYQSRWERTSLSFKYNLVSGAILTFSSPSMFFSFFSLGLLLFLFPCRFFFPLPFLVCHPCLVSVFLSLIILSSRSQCWESWSISKVKPECGFGMMGPKSLGNIIDKTKQIRRHCYVILIVLCCVAVAWLRALSCAICMCSVCVCVQFVL